jgi:glycine hydroxymethyltransferase
MYSKNMCIATFDQEISAAINKEASRQEDHIELIASENYTSPRVLEAQGSILTNKYAEGYPGKRYYSGCEYVDEAETLAITRAKQLFGAAYANVQPHSGSQANAAAYMALINPGDTILGMGLNEGGHLTHGASVSSSGKFYKSYHYGVKSNGEIDYDQVASLAQEHKPKLIIAGFSAYSRIVNWQAFREIADRVDAYFLADIAHVAGLVCTGLYPSPVNIADVTTTTTHKTLRGPRGGMILAKSNPELEKKLNSAVFPGSQGGGLMHVVAAKAVAFKEASLPEFKTYQQQVLKNAKHFANRLIERGFNIVSGGTDNHLFLLSLIGKNITGKDADNALSQANITVNKNTVPGDPLSPTITSGIRIGTPAITTRGFKEPEIDLIINWICDVLNDINSQATIDRARSEVLELCSKFPVYAK